MAALLITGVTALVLGQAHEFPQTNICNEVCTHGTGPCRGRVATSILCESPLVSIAGDVPECAEGLTSCAVATPDYIEQPAISSREGNLVFRVNHGKSVCFEAPIPAPNSGAGSSTGCVGEYVEWNAETNTCFPKPGTYGTSAEARQTVRLSDLARQDELDAVVSAQDTFLANTQSTLMSQASTLAADISSDLNALQDEVETQASELREGLQVTVNEIGASVNRLNTLPLIVCNDEFKGPNETDVDCGGICDPCATGKDCAANADCVSNNCEDGKCVINTCKRLYDKGIRADQEITLGFNGIASNVLSGSETAKVQCDFSTVSQGYIRLKSLVSGERHTFDSCGKGRSPDPPTEGACRARSQYGASSFGASVKFWKRTQVFVAPVDGEYRFTLYGALGGSEDDRGHSRSQDGQGGRTRATLVDIERGTHFYFRIGQQGQDADNGRDATSCLDVDDNALNYPSDRNGYCNNRFETCGGFNGGGPTIACGGPGGAGGSGGTDVRMCGNGEFCAAFPEVDNRILVAGGGGGGSAENGNHGGYPYRNGGDGGGATGEEGSRNDRRWAWGLPGTQTAGGRYRGSWGGSESPTECTAGRKGQGGCGGINDAGGGGGGYYGGGASPVNGGGAGGSGCINCKPAIDNYNIRIRDADMAGGVNDDGNGWIEVEIREKV